MDMFLCKRVLIKNMRGSVLYYFCLHGSKACRGVGALVPAVQFSTLGKASYSNDQTALGMALSMRTDRTRGPSYKRQNLYKNHPENLVGVVWCRVN